MRGYLTFTLLVLCLVSIVLAWFSVQRLDDFKAYHRAIAEESTQDIAHEVARYVDEKKRLVGLFADEYADLIHSLARSPDNGLVKTLEQRLAAYFPDYFGFTITDPQGRPFLEDFEGFVGDVCLADIADYVETGIQNTRIHPNPFVYHFDVMTRTRRADEEVIFFVSFHADILGGLVKNAQTPGHRLLLAYPPGEELIEVTSDGARINWMRDDYRLSEDEQSRILARQAVQGTGWDALNLRLPGLYEDYRRQLTRESLVIFLLFMTIGFSMLIYINREENLRRDAEHDKAEFLSGLSRDMRTPIEGLEGALAALKGSAGGSLDADAMALTDSAISHCQQLELLTRDLLEFENMKSGKLVFDRQPLELAALMDRCADRVDAQACGVRLAIGQVPRGVKVLADAERISQAICRLLAGSETRAGETITLELEARARDDMVRISLDEPDVDKSSGLQQGLLGRLFQKGRREARLPEDQGPGMSVVRYIMERHGGSLGFVMDPHRGPRFYFELPLYREA
jgi:signal transduction histidine kinase